jgi:DNA-binding beta-propeller fold protein YncE
VDGAGNLYVADEHSATIRKVTPAGVVTTLAGAAGQVGSADGTGSAARFIAPDGIAVDAAGNVFVVDSQGSNVRKIAPTGVTTTVAGVAGMTGISLGVAPHLGHPRGIAAIGSDLVVSDANAVLLLHSVPAH